MDKKALNHSRRGIYRMIVSYFNLHSHDSWGYLSESLLLKLLSLLQDIAVPSAGNLANGQGMCWQCAHQTAQTAQLQDCRNSAFATWQISRDGDLGQTDWFRCWGLPFTNETPKVILECSVFCCCKTLVAKSNQTEVIFSVYNSWAHLTMLVSDKAAKQSKLERSLLCNSGR